MNVDTLGYVGSPPGMDTHTYWTKGSVCNFFPFLSYVRKQLIIMSQMVGTEFFLAPGSGDGRTVMLQKLWKKWKVVQFPFANLDFISGLYVSINIYKQCKIAIKADEVEKKTTPHPDNDGAQSWTGIHLGVITSEGEIISDRLMELHHALGQWASPIRNNNERTRGTPMIYVAVELVLILLV